MPTLLRGQGPGDQRGLPACDRGRRDLPQLHTQRLQLAHQGRQHLGRPQVAQAGHGKVPQQLVPALQDKAPAGRNSDAGELDIYFYFNKFTMYDKIGPLLPT